MALILEKFEGFEWDFGNSNKNWDLHRVTDGECEDIFFNRPIIVTFDKRLKRNEPRYIALGRTDIDRHLFVAFTVRGKLIRVISARDMTRSDVRRYEEEAKRNTDFYKRG